MKTSEPYRAWCRSIQDDFAHRLSASDPDLIAARDALAAAWNHPVGDDDAADHLAQLQIAYWLWRKEHDDAAAVAWVLSAAEPWARLPLVDRRDVPSLGVPVPPDGRFLTSFERLLTNARRRRRGVYYTPRPLVRFVVRGLDDLLRQELQLTDGFASDDPSLQILDPACGTGLFLEGVLDAVANYATERGWNADERCRVMTGMATRLCGLELLPGACLVARLQLASRLLAYGVDPARVPPPAVALGNALAGPEQQPLLRRPFTVILGNPPYRGLSENHLPWITGLLKGTDPPSGGGYFEVDGRPLNERKHWLHDDYVKFFRLAQWRIETTGRGLIGFVTNHGYLDNATFRGMRASLLAALPRVSVIDLHGNRNAGETPPAGGRDENIFGIDQGVSIAFLRRWGAETAPLVNHGELWGTTAAKNAVLESSPPSALPFAIVAPSSPNYVLKPVAASPRYSPEQSWRLCDAMPANCTAPVTARDGFVTAFTREELLERLAAFCDLSVSDDEVRRRYFQNGRSVHYPPGDTRGWKLSAARQKLSADDARADCVRPFLYRPFDQRWIAWHPALIDWPRPEITRHMTMSLTGDVRQRTLIARRQIPPGKAASYFFVTDTLTLDGVIRSDNRGSESLFPLYLQHESGPTANFAPDLVEAFSARLKLTWQPRGCGDGEHSLGPEDIAAYIYGVWHRAEYRTLTDKSDFPRVFVPADIADFTVAVRRGRRLIELHLQSTAVTAAGDETWELAPRFPKFADGRVLLNPSTVVTDISPAAWNLRIGSHQPAYKWLADRRGRTLTAGDLAAYRRVVVVLEATAAEIL